MAPQAWLRGPLLDGVLEGVLEHLATVGPSELDKRRAVGKGELPSNVRGLLYHLAEHATRLVGQLITTLNVSRELPIPPGPVDGPPDEAGRGHSPGGALPHSPRSLEGGRFEEGGNRSSE